MKVQCNCIYIYIYIIINVNPSFLEQGISTIVSHWIYKNGRACISQELTD